MNSQSNYLKMVFGIMGISTVHTVAVNGASTDRSRFEEAEAHQRITMLIGQEEIRV